MIHYNVGILHLGFICRIRGSTCLKALPFAVGSATLSFFIRWGHHEYPSFVDELGIHSYLGNSQSFNAMGFILGLLMATRCSQALKRFWEGLTLVHQMSAEWFDATSSLVAFSHKGSDEDAMNEFQHLLVRLMSLMHGAALYQIKENHNEDFEVLGVEDLNQESLDYLVHCKEFGINRVEVMLHWVHELVTANIDTVLKVPAPILSRAYQELSRGMVNLNDCRKITETPFPFPLAQTLVVLLLAYSVVLPVMVAMYVENACWCAVLAFLCTFSMWSVNLIAGELEQPFGNDANDLPLALLQCNLNKSLLVLLDPRAQTLPRLRSLQCTERVRATSAKVSFMTVSTATHSTPVRPVGKLDLNDIAEQGVHLSRVRRVKKALTGMAKRSLRSDTLNRLSEALSIRSGKSEAEKLPGLRSTNMIDGGNQLGMAMMGSMLSSHDRNSATVSIAISSEEPIRYLSSEDGEDGTSVVKVADKEKTEEEESLPGERICATTPPLTPRSASQLRGGSGNSKDTLAASPLGQSFFVSPTRCTAISQETAGNGLSNISTPRATWKTDTSGSTGILKTENSGHSNSRMSLQWVSQESAGIETAKRSLPRSILKVEGDYSRAPSARSGDSVGSEVALPRVILKQGPDFLATNGTRAVSSKRR